MKFYDIELVDVNPEVDNFCFEKVSEKDLSNIIESFKKSDDFLEFTSNEAKVILERSYFRGIMHQIHFEKKKSVIQETMENANPIAKVEIKKKKVELKE